MAPEQEVRAEIDKLLSATGWSVQPRDKVDLTAAQGVAICEYPLKKGHGFADYLLYVDGAAVGVIEAKKAGVPLTAIEIQTAKYSEGLPDHIPAPRRPLPFCYQSTAVETRFTNLLEPDARSRAVPKRWRTKLMSNTTSMKSGRRSRNPAQKWMPVSMWISGTV